jgi:hypothetical protein
MRLFGRTGRPTPPPELDAQLHQIFDDRRTPGAPETLYLHLREVSMDSSTSSGRGRGWLLGGLGRMSRTATALTAVLIVVAGAIAVTVVIPRTIGVGAGPSASPSYPATPRAPVGWSFKESFGISGGFGVGGSLVPTAPRIAVHVVCRGWADLVVFASTVPGDQLPEGVAVQAVRFTCSPDGREGRVELAAPNGEEFQEVTAHPLWSESKLADTIYTVSIEVPDNTPTPSPSR